MTDGSCRYYGGGYINAFRIDMEEYRTFKVSRILKVNGHKILKVNGHNFSRIFWNQIGDNFNVI